MTLGSINTICFHASQGAKVSNVIGKNATDIGQRCTYLGSFGYATIVSINTVCFHAAKGVKISKALSAVACIIVDYSIVNFTWQINL
jgi:hypothetical protein